MSDLVQRLMSAPGPVGRAFLHDKSLFPLIMGPVGSAKTTMCIARAVMATLWQEPGQDGVRRSRGVIIRDTYPNLKETTVQSWHQWFPKELGEWSGDSPFTHRLAFGISRPRDVQIEAVFMAIGDRRVEDVLRGSEWTWGWLNEADRLSPAVAQFLLGRLRWRSPKGGGGWVGLWADCNAPDTDNWVYKWFVDREATGELGEGNLTFHRQPGGRSPAAENLGNLLGGRTYYDRQMIGASKDYVRRMIDNEFGAVRNGMPVFPEFQDSMHVSAEDVAPAAGLPLIVAADAGLTPAAVIGQVMPDGQLRILDELVFWIEDGQQLDRTGPRAFGRALRALLQARFPGMEVAHAACDPAAGKGTDGSIEDLSWMQQASIEAKLRFRPAPCPDNSLAVRLEAVRRPLLRTLEGQRPGLLISRRAKTLRRAMNSGYVYRRTALAGGDGRYSNEPVKNQFSHIADAAQYFCLAAGEGRAAISGRADGAPPPVIEVFNDYDVFGEAP